MDEKLVTIGTFGNETEFLLARGRLEAAGIESFAQNENQFRMGLRAEGCSVWIVLQVRESDAQDALAILNDPGAGGNQPD